VSLREWWTAEVMKTGRNLFDILSSVLRYVEELDLIQTNPVYAFRKVIGRRRTQKGRVEADAGKDIRPVEDPEDLERLIDSARESGLEVLVYALLMLDAGLRRGEALGLRWRSVAWG
jgi:integrase